jgi:hypothetical protein
MLTIVNTKSQIRKSKNVNIMGERQRLRLKELNVTKWRLVVWALGIAAFILVFGWLVLAKKNGSLSLDTDESINITPEQIQSIRNIGEWEFLAVSDEELVDTVRKRLLGDDELVRIYYGTMRLGINLHHTKPDWIQASGDTIVATLPAVGLLDRNFIDEARTKAFYESGRWTAKDREALYRKAYRMMLSHGLTPENLRTAEENADAQLRKMFRAMGYNNIVIRFEETDN